MQLKPADTAFSKCIRAAAGWKCQGCGKQYEEGSQGLHCSHNFSRRHRTIRWCKENALALCFTCHQWFGGEPADSGVWLEEYLGSGTLEILREKRDFKVKIPKSEEKEIAAHYRKEYKRIKERLDAGEEPPIPFDSWQ